MSPGGGDIAALERRIELARQRTAAALERARLRRAELDAAVHAATAVTNEQLAELDRRHAVIVAGIHSDARAEVERIQARARRDAGHHMNTSDAEGVDGAA